MLFVIIALVLVVVLVLLLTKKSYTRHKAGIVLITGASTGIGRHAAEHIAKKSKFLVLAGVRKEVDAESIRSMNIPNLKPLIIDVAVHSSCVTAVDNIRVMMKELSLPFVCLVNNAGINRHLVAEFQPVEDAKALFDTNFFGVLDLVQLTTPLLRESKGRIINLSSVSGFISVPAMGIYSASKFAIEGLSDALRRELAHFGISVSLIQPAFVKTTIAATTEAASEDLVRDPEVHGRMTSLYSKFHSSANAAKVASILKRADTTEVTSAAIEHALMSQYPQTRYPVANSNGMPSWALTWVVWLLNDRLRDIMIANK